MSGISTIVFNGSNAYELSTGHKATSWPHGAVGIEQVSAGVQLRSPTAGAGMILRIRAIASSGLLISELSQTHILTVQNNWERAEKTFTLPAGTVKIELRLVAVGGAILFAQPKLANGASVGAYATNFAPQLTMITPTGIYTGTVTAEQIILTGGERLPDRLVTINASMLSMTSRIDGEASRISVLEAGTLKLGDRYNGVKIDQSSGLNIASTINGQNVEIRLNTSEGLAYYSGGAFIGGLKMVDGQVSSVAGAITSDIDLNRFTKMGSTPYGYGMTVYDKAKQSDPVISVQSGLDGGAMLLDDKQVARFHAYPDGHIILRGLGGVERLTLDNFGGFTVSDHQGQLRLMAAADGGILLRDKARDRMSIYPNSSGMIMSDYLGQSRIAYDANASYLRSTEGKTIEITNAGASINGNTIINGNTKITGTTNGLQIVEYASGGRGIGLPNGFMIAFELNKINILNQSNIIVHTFE